MATNTAIEADSSESFSDYESGNDSDMTSIADSIYNYKYENGRTYHSYKAGRYLMPNDEKEQDRLDIIHHIFRLSLQGELCTTKLDNPQSILDIGTGTGIWAIEMGDLYPSAHIIGTDLSPIQPQWVPPNVVFEVDDAELEWLYPKSSFDMIHARSLGGSLRDWPAFLEKSLEHLKPGGSIEIVDIPTDLHCDDKSFPETMATYKWKTLFTEATLKMDRPWDIQPKMQELLKEAGFVNIVQEKRIMPIGAWPRNARLKEIGRFAKVSMTEGGLESYSMALLTRSLGMPAEEVEELLKQVREEYRSNKMHIYSFVIHTRAQRPA